jgi:hypothetical protein
MSDTPPPAPDRPVQRPGIVTAAAVLLIVAGGFSVLGGLLLLTGAGVAAGVGVGGLFIVLALISLGLGALEIYAGVQCLNLKESGRQIGVILAVIAAVLQVFSIGRSPGTAIVGIALDLFVVYALTQNKQYFTA